MAKILLENMNTNVLPVISISRVIDILEPSVFDASCIDESDLDEDELGPDIYAEAVQLIRDDVDDTDLMYRQVEREAPYYIQEAFDDYDIKAKVLPGGVNIYNNRWGMYYTEFTVEVDAAWVENTFMELSTDEAFIEYINRNFTSRDGFISSMPNNIKDLTNLLDIYNTDYWKLFSELVQFFVEQDESIHDSITDDMADSIYGSPDFRMFQDYGIYR